MTVAMKNPMRMTLSAFPSLPLQAIATASFLSACACGWACESNMPSPTTVADRGAGSSAMRPRAAFAQVGLAHEVTAVSAGAIWDIPWDALGTRWSTYVEASASRWQSRGGQPSETGVLTQIAFIPVLRYRFDESRSPWFAEGGIGATVTSSIYRGRDSQFSTSFNFGDHVGLGYSFGGGWKNEIALRAEHFSNAGIKRPNPGKSFIELRYVRSFE